ncbi:MAG: hypothetical protein ACQESA_00830 [Patescibacteria group bacterium]
MANEQNVQSFQVETERVVFKNIDKARSLGGESKGYVVLMTFEEFPSEIKRLEGRKILYQYLHNFPDSSKGEFVYLIPSVEFYKLNSISCEMRTYEMLENGEVTWEDHEPLSIQILMRNGLSLKRLH